MNLPRDRSAHSSSSPTYKAAPTHGPTGAGHFDKDRAAIFAHVGERGLAEPTCSVCFSIGMSDEREIIAKGKTPLVRPWTEDDDARLLEMVAQKRHRSMIAASLKRTRSGIRGRLRRLHAAQRLISSKKQPAKGLH